jgi:hypothetical protein
VLGCCVAALPARAAGGLGRCIDRRRTMVQQAADTWHELTQRFGSMAPTMRFAVRHDAEAAH